VGAVLLLALLLLTDLPRGDRVPEGALALPGTLEVEAGDPVWLDDDRSERAWSELLQHAAEAPVTAVVPGSPPAVRIAPPPRLRAGRPAALGIQANTPVDLVLTSPTGLEEHLRLGEGEEGAFLLRPREAGWARWTLGVSGGVSGAPTPSPAPDSDPASDPASGPDPAPPPAPASAPADSVAAREIEWHGYVTEARPLRVLALSGPPAPESRMAIRALEEAGEEVEAWIHLGRDLWVGREGGPLPTTPAAYAEFDVVLLFPGLELGPAAANALGLAVREAGLGLGLAGTTGGSGALAHAVLGSIVGAPADPPGTVELWDAARPIRADSLSWSLPPTVPPLPGLELTTSLRPLLGAPPTAAATLGVLGRGRIAALSVTGSWQWRMEEGRDEEHRAYWRSLVEWLSDGLVDDPHLEPLAADLRPGDPLHLRWSSGEEADPDGPGPLLRELRDAGDTWDAAGAGDAVDAGDAADRVFELPAPRTSPLGRTTLASYTALEPGAIAFLPVDSLGEALSPAIGVAVAPVGAPSSDPAGRLARLAGRSPGGAVRVQGADGLGPGTVAPDPSGRGWDDRAGSTLVRSLLLSLLLILFGTGWILRRRAGRP
jgi:hypothetical protein